MDDVAFVLIIIAFFALAVRSRINPTAAPTIPPIIAPIKNPVLPFGKNKLNNASAKPRPSGSQRKVQAGTFSVFIDFEAKLCSDDHLAAERLESFADKFFIRVGAIDLSRIEECYAAFNGATNERDPILLIGDLAVGATRSATWTLQADTPDRKRRNG